MSRDTARRALLLVNPSAGRGRAARSTSDLSLALEKRGFEVEIQESESGEHLIELAQNAGRGDRLIVSCGGDGTLHHVLQGLDLETARLAVAPLGSGNDFATVVGMPRDVAGVATVIGEGRTIKVDVALANDRRYLGVAALGFDSVVARFAQGVRFLRGSAIYLYATLRVLASFQPYSLRYDIDGERREERLMLAAVGNTDRYGGGVRITPGADFRDRLLDACIVRECSALELLMTLPGAYRGAHVKSRFVELIRGRELRFESEVPMEIFADGELVTTTPVTFRIEPRRLEVVRGPIEAQL